MSIVTDKSSLDDFLDDYQFMCRKFNLMFSGLMFIDPLDEGRLNIQIKELTKEGMEDLKEGGK